MHAWIAMAFGGEGNPYADEPSVAYAYDDRVQNHKQVQVGDLLFLRNKSRLEGVGRIESIEEGEGEKTFLRCPKCGSGRVHERKASLPPYKCNNGHEFDFPEETKSPVHTFRASFADSWLSVGDRISVAELRPFELRDSKQLAIMPADTDLLCLYVARRCPGIATQLLEWGNLDGSPLGDTDADNGPELTPLGKDERERINREIRRRRGQAAFRNSLLARHHNKCVISGCAVLGVLEAAHIRPYRGPRDHDPANGLLLRSDLHTLFDLNRIGIEPGTRKIIVHPSLLGSEYENFNEKYLLVTEATAPDKRALRLRWKDFIAAAEMNSDESKH